MKAIKAIETENAENLKAAIANIENINETIPIFFILFFPFLFMQKISSI